ncbi:MAG TPA: hypothetical protein PK950_02040 [Candidatus Paceibacterota bacterium]|nr:hypothetical protein [Candidatus Paceibacterota bacterium]
MEAEQKDPKTYATLTYRQFLIPAIVMVVLSFIVMYRASLALSPYLESVALGYFIVVLLLGYAIETGLVAWAARLAKIEGRSWSKALFLAAGINFINGTFSLATTSILATNRAMAGVLVFGCVLAIWFFIKRVYSLKNTQVFRFLLWILLIIGIAAFVIGIISSLFLTKALGN